MFLMSCPNGNSNQNKCIYKGDQNWYFLQFSHCKLLQAYTNEIEHFEKKKKKKTIACTTIRAVYVSDILWFFDICTIFQFNKQTSKGSSLLCMNKIYLQVKLEL